MLSIQPSIIQRLCNWSKDNRKIIIYAALFFLFPVGIFLSAEADNSIIKEFAKALSISVLAVAVDRLIFIDEIQQFISKSVNQTLGISDIGVEKTFDEGIQEIFRIIKNDLKKGDKLTILETFVDLTNTDIQRSLKLLM